MTARGLRRGAILMTLSALVFALQDGISRHLAESYNVYMVVMIRYWFFALFALALAARRLPGGIGAALRPRFAALQVLRGLLLAAEICAMISAFTLLGLVESHAVFACYPLIVAALSGPVLGERVGWRRWAAIGTGLVGVLIILQPGLRVFAPAALVPLAAAVMFALYGLLTRYVARGDSAMVSFLWTGLTGAVVMTALGLFHLEPMSPRDQVWMAVLCCTAALGHGLMIRAFELAEASALQPFAYLLLPFAAGIGITVFGDRLEPHVAIGAGIVVASGLFTLWRARRTGRGAGVSGP